MESEEYTSLLSKYDDDDDDDEVDISIHFSV
jgi:hypothetical protein